ncbi:CRTAC1 family protein [Plesiocystis pacifica]|uniref:CRTAC1 family protein n=1 Tax=Plesiocystis pacifica TaxID=191768 RepID=UPI0012F79B71|nr:CRTAC1 family protein [Plesiocystis pacifica]
MLRARWSVFGVAALLVACRGPSLGLDDEAGSSTDPTGVEAGTDTGVPGCEPWPEPPSALGMGPTMPLSFVDVSVEAGLVGVDYYEGTWPDGCDPNGTGVVEAPCKMILQGGGAAAGDADLDGWPDLYLTRLGARDQLWLNQGDGSFTELGDALGLDAVFDGNGAAWVDVDADGDLDLYVTTFGDPERYRFYRNTLIEDGALAFVEEGSERGLALDDGLPHWGFSVAVGDYDRDGWLDLYTSEWRPGPSVLPETSHARLLRNRGAAAPGVFEDQTLDAQASTLAINPAGTYVFAPAFVDLDEDGWLDLAVVADNGTSKLLWNAGDGSFIDGTPTAKVGIERNGMGSAFGDLDGDGHLDWYVSAIFSPDDEDTDCGNSVCGNGGNRLYRSFGPRCFEETSRDLDVHVGGWGWGTAAWDPDNDGDLDLVEVNGFHVPHGPPGGAFLNHPMRLWQNGSEFIGETAFSHVADASGLDDPGQGRGLLTFDYDRDGDLDLLVVDNKSGARLWRNELGQENAWLDVELRGDPSSGNLAGVGARVELIRDVDAATQVRVMGVDTHFLGQGENRVHFGLGPSEAPVTEVRVVWPTTGEVSVRTNVSARQVLVIDEAG